MKQIIIVSAISVLSLVSAGCGRTSARIAYRGALAQTEREQTTYDPTFSCNPEAPAQAGTMPSAIRRLAKVHYVNSLREMLSQLSAANRDVLVAGIQNQLDLIPDDMSAHYSRNDDRLAQQHAETAFEIGFALAEQLSANNTYVNQLVKVCGAGSTRASLANATCLDKFVTYYGREAFRRPLSAAEKAEQIQFYNSMGTDGLAALMARLFSHPRFFYRLDNEGTRVAGADGVDAVYQLSQYELLSKITFLYWDSPPDDALYTQVATMDLTRDADLEQVVAQVTSDARARNGIRNFYGEWLKLKSVPALDAESSAAFATFAAGENVNEPGHNHRDDMVQEVLDLTDHYTFAPGGRYEDLLTSPYSFARTQDLANLYGVAPWDGNASNLVRFPAGQRSGLLTRAAMLVSGTEYTRPIIKGREVRVQLLCDEIPPPPASLQIKPLVQNPHQTTREVVEASTSHPKCMSCHTSLNPIGFATENYDSLGRYRADEAKFDEQGYFVNRLAVSTEVRANIFPGDTALVSDGVELSAHIAETGKGHQCMVRQYFRYSFGRDESLSQDTDGCSLESMRNGLMASDGSLLEMFKSSAKQYPFKYRRVQ